MLMFVVVLFLTLGAALPSQASRERRELLPIADSYVRSSGPDFNWGIAHHLWVASGQEEMISFLMFDLSEIPSDALVEEAALRLYASVVDIETVVGVHYCADNDWTELGITYSNKPEFQPEPLDSANITTALAWYEWNIADTTRSTLGATDKRLSLVVKTETEKEAWITFGSTNPMLSPSETGEDWRPRLSVLYSYSPGSGPDPVLIGLLAIGIVGTSIVALELAYIQRKRGKQAKQRSGEIPSHPDANTRQQTSTT